MHYLFMKLFLVHSKTKNTVKDKNQNFTSIKLNDKKSEYSLAKKVICECLAPYWFPLKFNGKLDLLKVKHEFTRKQMFSVNSFTRHKLFDENFWYVNDKHLYFKTKAELSENKRLFLRFLGGPKEAISTTRTTFNRSICSQKIFKIGILKDFTNFTEKHLY